MLNALFAGKEKAIIGGLSAGMMTLLSQLGVNGQMTVKEAVYAAAAWLVTHAIIYVTTNTSQPGTLLSDVDAVAVAMEKAATKFFSGATPPVNPPQQQLPLANPQPGTQVTPTTTPPGA